MTCGQQCKLFDHKLFFSAENCILPTEVRKEALQLQELLEYDDGGAEGECYFFFVLAIIISILSDSTTVSVFILFCVIISVFTYVDFLVLVTGVSSHIDDEYKWAGVEDPKLMVTTSRDPSSRLKMFAKVSRGA